MQVRMLQVQPILEMGSLTGYLPLWRANAMQQAQQC